MGNYQPVHGHEPIRVPVGWKDQDRALIIQLERIFDDIYKRFRKTRLDDLDGEVRGLLDQMLGDISDLDGRLDTAEDDITSLDGRMDDAEDNITSVSTELSALYGLTVTQLKGK